MESFCSLHSPIIKLSSTNFQFEKIMCTSANHINFAWKLLQEFSIAHPFFSYLNKLCKLQNERCQLRMKTIKESELNTFYQSKIGMYCWNLTHKMIIKLQIYEANCFWKAQQLETCFLRGSWCNPSFETSPQKIMIWIFHLYKRFMPTY